MTKYFTLDWGASLEDYERELAADEQERLLEEANRMTNSSNLPEVHRWLCHPGEECEGGCDRAAIPVRLEAYRSVRHDCHLGSIRPGEVSR